MTLPVTAKVPLGGDRLRLEPCGVAVLREDAATA